MNLETKITIYNFTPSGFYVDPIKESASLNNVVERRILFYDPWTLFFVLDIFINHFDFLFYQFYICFQLFNFTVNFGQQAVALL